MTSCAISAQLWRQVQRKRAMSACDIADSVRVQKLSRRVLNVDQHHPWGAAFACIACSASLSTPEWRRGRHSRTCSPRSACAIPIGGSGITKSSRKLDGAEWAYLSRTPAPFAPHRCPETYPELPTLIRSETLVRFRREAQAVGEPGSSEHSADLRSQRKRRWRAVLQHEVRRWRKLVERGRLCKYMRRECVTLMAKVTRAVHTRIAREFCIATLNPVIFCSTAEANRW